MRDVGRGFAVLRAHPRLWKYIVAPAVISALVLAGLIAAVVALSRPLVAWTTGFLPDALAHVAGAVMSILIGAVLAVGALFLFVTIAGMIAGPFNEALSEHVESALTGRPAAETSFGELIRGVVVGIVHSLRRLTASLIGFALVFLVGLIPVVGTIAAVGFGVWLTASAAAYDCYDAVFGRRAMAYRAKLAYLKAHRGRSLGLGGAVAAMLLVPGLNLIALGVGAAGATVAMLELERAPIRRSARS